MTSSPRCSGRSLDVEERGDADEIRRRAGVHHHRVLDAEALGERPLEAAHVLAHREVARRDDARDRVELFLSPAGAGQVVERHARHERDGAAAAIARRVRIVELLERVAGRRRDVGQADAARPAPSSRANPFSAARQPISAQRPPFIHAVSTTTRRPVFCSDSRMIASSSGLTVRRSIDLRVDALGRQRAGRLHAQLDRVRGADDRHVAGRAGGRCPCRSARGRCLPARRRPSSSASGARRRRPGCCRGSPRAAGPSRRQGVLGITIFKPGHAEQHAVDRLRMLRARSPAAADRRPHDHRHGRLRRCP